MEQSPAKQRIWELDALRGLFLLCMMVFHLIFDLTSFTSCRIHLSDWLYFIQDYGGAVFILLSGLCATLGSRSVRRGLTVFGCGLLITLVTALGAKLGYLDGSLVVRFGILHLLGLCMLLYAPFRRLPTACLAALGAAFLLLGYYFSTLTVQSGWLFPLGLTNAQFASGDYFPLLPHLGWFLLGVVLGRTLYRNRRTLLPRVPENLAPLRLLRFCGRYSLQLYLLHQPVFIGILLLATTLL